MTIRILQGDCREMLKGLADESVHAIVTDPPYHLTNNSGAPTSDTPHSRAKAGATSRGFMGMVWDGGNVAFQPDVWRECLRVLKPGGHCLAFGGARTYHRLACAIEDAGFVIRDQALWIYGSGFPKSHNLHEEFEGWGTALKPAHEPIVVARKPFKGTVAENMRAHGVGAYNIAACKIEGAKPATTCGAGERGKGWGMQAMGRVEDDGIGRWPANVMHDGSAEVLSLFPEAPGQLAAITGNEPSGNSKTVNAYGKMKRGGYVRGKRPGGFANVGAEKGDPTPNAATYADTGSAARFFYCPKADRADRNVGCDDLPEKDLNLSSGSESPGTFQSEGTKRSASNHHPTVKPTELMRWLVRLVTPKGGVVVDPFAGSGSTGRAADMEGCDAVLIELDPAYVAIARQRCAGDIPLFMGVQTSGV